MKKNVGNSNGVIHLIPMPIAASEKWQFSDTIFSALMTCHVLVCERIRTVRRQIRKFFTEEQFDRLLFLEMDKHAGADYIRQASKYLQDGLNVGVLSEAGMPCIADPGYQLVDAAHRLNVQVIPHVGPSSFFLALMASGLSGQSFCFHGYLPRDKNELERSLRQLTQSVVKNGGSQLFMETPYRNQKLFDAIMRYVSKDTKLNVSIDISGPNEFIQTRTVQDWKKVTFKFNEKKPAVFILGR